MLLTQEWNQVFINLAKIFANCGTRPLVKFTCRALGQCSGCISCGINVYCAGAVLTPPCPPLPPAPLVMQRCVRFGTGTGCARCQARTYHSLHCPIQAPYTSLQVRIPLFSLCSKSSCSQVSLPTPIIRPATMRIAMLLHECKLLENHTACLPVWTVHCGV